MCRCLSACFVMSAAAFVSDFYCRFAFLEIVGELVGERFITKYTEVISTLACLNYALPEHINTQQKGSLEKDPFSLLPVYHQKETSSSVCC